MRSLFLVLLAVYFSTRFVVAQYCTSTADCYTPSIGYTATCRSFLCYNCPLLSYGGVNYPQVFITNVCTPACKPGSAGDALCANLRETGFYCFPRDTYTSAFTKDAYGYTSTINGLCLVCDPGYTVNAARTGCLPNSLTFSPPLYDSSPPPTNDRPPPPIDDSPPPPADESPPLPPPSPTPTTSSPSPPPLPQVGNPGASPSTSGSTPSSNSSTEEKKTGIPAWVVKTLAVTIPGAILTGIVGLVFYCITSRHRVANERRKYPLADAVRAQLKLKKVDDFDSRLGLQFRTSVEMLSNTLESRGVLKPPALLGNSTIYLAMAIAAALKMRHKLDWRHNEKGFLALFANDCGDEPSRNALSFDVEEKVAGNKGWHQKLVLPPSAAAVPTVPSAQAPHPPQAPHAAYWMPPSAPPEQF